MTKFKTHKQLINTIKEMLKENETVSSSDILKVIEENEQLIKTNYKETSFKFIIEGDINDSDYIYTEAKLCEAEVKELEKIAKKLSDFVESEDYDADIDSYLIEDELELWEEIIPYESCSGIPVHTVYDIEVKMNNEEDFVHIKEVKKLRDRLCSMLDDNVNQLIRDYSNLRR